MNRKSIITSWLLIIGFLLVANSVLAANAFENNNPCLQKKFEKYVPIAQRYDKGLFFKIAKCRAEPSYIFGTMHSDAKNLMPLVEPVYKKLDNAKSANFELKEEPKMMLAVMQAMYFEANAVLNLEMIIGAELYQKFKKVMKIAQPFQPEISYRRMKPWAAALILQYPPNTNDAIVVDARIQNYAKEKQVKIVGLETAEEQLGIFDKMSMEDQVDFLKESVESFEKNSEMNDELANLYLAQDLLGMQKMAEKVFAEMENENLKKLFMEELIISRNKRMVKGMLPGLNEGGSVTAVGALHLPGEDGILALLEAQGYYISVVE